MKPSDSFVARFVDRPEQAVDGIKIQCMFVRTDGDARLSTVSDWSQGKGIVLSMHFNDFESHQCDGSAVMVGPGIAICATHVIEPHLDDLLHHGKRSLCVGIGEGGAQLWTIRHVSQVASCDVSVLGLRAVSALPPASPLHQAALTTRTPAIGERLTVLGFRTNENAVSVEGQNIRWGGALLQVKGTVVEQYVMGRDRVLLPGPCVMLDCETLGGMSGGPVFDDRGYLVGILAAGMDTEQGGGPSYVSLLWNCLGQRIKADWLPGIHPQECTLLELAGKVCMIERPEAVKATTIGAETHTEYSSWS